VSGLGAGAGADDSASRVVQRDVTVSGVAAAVLCVYNYNGATLRVVGRGGPRDLGVGVLLALGKGSSLKGSNNEAAGVVEAGAFAQEHRRETLSHFQPFRRRGGTLGC
jgi:hypothetical protein